MPLTVTTERGSSSSIKYAILQIAWDTSYATGGEVLDLSSTGVDLPWNEVFGAVRISTTLNDGGWMPSYVRDGDATGATGALATGTIQLYEDRTPAAAQPLAEVAGTTNVSAQTNEYWFVIGR